VSNATVTATATTAELDPAPIPSSWILAGTPVARNRKLVKSHDRTTDTVVWECTEGRFNWHYAEDETLVVIYGEAFITNERGEERRLGAGDMCFFPAGSSATWRVTDTIRKVAVLRQTMPRPLVFGLRVWNKLLRMAGLARRSPWAPIVLLCPTGM